MISAIVAHGINREIGRQNNLLCHLPGDLKWFKEMTSGHTVIMGRKTWASLPKKPLPGRHNIVLSSSPQTRQLLLSEGAHQCPTLEECVDWLATSRKEEIFIIGGEQIYRILLPKIDKLYVSIIPRTFPDADTFFPEYATQFELISSEKCDGYDRVILMRKQ